MQSNALVVIEPRNAEKSARLILNLETEAGRALADSVLQAIATWGLGFKDCEKVFDIAEKIAEGTVNARLTIRG